MIHLLGTSIQSSKIYIPPFLLSIAGIETSFTPSLYLVLWPFLVFAEGPDLSEPGTKNPLSLVTHRLVTTIAVWHLRFRNTYHSLGWCI